MSSKTYIGPLEIEHLVVGDEWGLQHLEAEWNEFVESHFSIYFYRSYSWSKAWWQAYARGDRVEIFLLRLRESGSLVGILPLWVKRGSFGGFPVRRLEVLGRGLGYEDLLIDPDYVDLARESLGAVLKGVKWDVAVFTNLLLESTSSLIRGMAAESSIGVAASNVLSHYVSTVGDFQDYCRARSKNFRKSLKTTKNRSERAGDLSFERYDVTSIPGSKLEIARGIAEQSWQYEMGTSHFCQHGGPSLIEALSQCSSPGAAEPELWLWKIGDDYTALFFGTRCGSRYDGIELAYREDSAWFSPGKHLLLQVLEELFQDPLVQVLDLGSGSEYKKSFTDEAVTALNLVLYRDSAYGKILSSIVRSRAFSYLRHLKEAKFETIARAITRRFRES